MTKPKLLDTVAILSSLTPDRLLQVESKMTLPIGLIGTIVQTYPETNTYLIEFSDAQGCEYAMAIVPANELLIVHLDLNPNTIELIAA
jgi:hypothetical protein